MIMYTNFTQAPDSANFFRYRQIVYTAPLNLVLNLDLDLILNLVLDKCLLSSTIVLESEVPYKHCLF